MVQLGTVRSAVSSLAEPQTYVAAFVGGTSGIGEYTLRALAKVRAEKGTLHVYIVGRNARAAETIIAECTRMCPGGRFRFVKAEDLSLLKDVDRVCAEIVKTEQVEATDGRHPKLDLLVMSQACSVFQQRKETEEGLDFLMSLMYYSRMRFITQLLPLLLASDLPARVISVYAAGTGDKLFVDDFSLRDPSRYGYFQARSHITYLTTAFMESLAERYPEKLSLTHVFPGLVMTPAFQDPTLPLWFKFSWALTGPIMKFWAVSSDEIGARILFLATSRFPARASNSMIHDTDVKRLDSAKIAIGTDGQIGSGAYSVGEKGDVIPPYKNSLRLDKSQLRTKGWDHTMRAFEEIAAGRKFTG